ncbi:MAG: efflux RND transporter permease subunit [Gemmataceae bacterium]
MFARFFVDRPIFATVLSVVIVLVGLVALVRLPLAQYPEVAPPTISVTAVFPGANARVVADTVATPIEQEINGVEDMIYMSSRCTNDGQMILDITFALGTDLDKAQVLVQNRVAIAQAKLPEEVQRQGVTTKKKSPSILLCINLLSDKVADPETKEERYKYDQLYLSNFATREVKDELARLHGVGDVQLLGPRDYSMRVWLDPRKLAARDLMAGDVTRAIREQNTQVAAGRLGQPPTPAGQDFQLPLNSQGRLESEAQFRRIVLKTDGEGGLTYLGDVVADDRPDQKGVELGAKSYDVNSYLDGQPSVTIAVYQQPGSNALDTARSIRDKMEALQAGFPSAIHYKIVYDTTVFIEESIHEVYKTLLEAFVLVFIVVLVFLQDWRATLLPMIDVPVSLIGTLAIMALFGFSLNNLSLFGLVLAIGIVVDDAIVVVENIERWMAKGLPPREATIKAMEEITGPVIAITLVLCAVFVPTAFLAGISGQFFRQFALTIAASTVISALNAMTMAPARAVTLIKPHSAGHGQREALPRLGVAVLAGLAAAFFFSAVVGSHIGLNMGEHGTGPAVNPWALWGMRGGLFALGALAGWFVSPAVNFLLLRFFDGFNWFFNRLTEGYGVVVGGILRLSLVVLLLYGGLLGLTYYEFLTVPQGFIPEQDKGYLIVNAQLPEGASLERADAVVARMTAIARGTEGVAHTIGVPGYSVLTGNNLSNVGGMFVVLSPFEERVGRRELGADAIAEKLQQAFGEIQEAQVVVFGAPPVDGLGSTGGFKMQVQDRRGLGPLALQGAVANVAEEASAQPALMGLFSSFTANQPQLYVDVDRVKAKQERVSLTDVFDTLQIYLGSAYVNDVTLFNRNWQVNVQADAKFRLRREDVGNLKLRNADGETVPLSTLIAVKDAAGPAIVNHYNLYPSAEINGAPAPGASSGQAIGLMERIAAKELPAGMSYQWTELTYQQIEAEKDLLTKLIFPLSVVFVFLVLAAQYESWSLPLAIILIVPMCLLAALAGVGLMGLDNDIFTRIGLVVLIGLAAKNAILVVEFAKQREEEGVDRLSATLEASKVRLRPILMTSLAFILGVVPLALAKGAGAEMRVALGVTVFCGMLGVTLFGLIFTPLFYVAIRRLAGGRTATAPAAVPADKPDLHAEPGTVDGQSASTRDVEVHVQPKS